MDIEASGIYQIRHIPSGNLYIGSAAKFRTRWNAHRRLLRMGSHHSPRLQRAWNRDGEGAFLFEIIFECDRDELISLEQAEINKKSPAYNVCKVAGSTAGRVLSIESREKIAAKQIGRKHGERSKEWREALSTSLSGKQKSEAHNAAFQAGRKRRIYSQEQRDKLSLLTKKQYENGTRSRYKHASWRDGIGKALAVLSDDQVREMRRMRSEGVTLSELSCKFGLSKPTVSEISRGLKYKWVS